MPERRGRLRDRDEEAEEKRVVVPWWRKLWFVCVVLALFGVFVGAAAGVWAESYVRGLKEEKARKEKLRKREAATRLEERRFEGIDLATVVRLTTESPAPPRRGLSEVEVRLGPGPSHAAPRRASAAEENRVEAFFLPRTGAGGAVGVQPEYEEGEPAETRLAAVPLAGVLEETEPLEMSPRWGLGPMPRGLPPSVRSHVPMPLGGPFVAGGFTGDLGAKSPRLAAPEVAWDAAEELRGAGHPPGIGLQ